MLTVRRWASRFAVVVAIGAVAAVGTPAYAEGEPGETQPTEAARVTIDEVTPYIGQSTREVHVAGTVVNTGMVPIAGEINLRLASDPSVDAAALEQWQRAGVDDYDAWVVAANVLGEPIAPGATLPFRFDVPTSAFGFDALTDFAWGPLGIVVDLATSRRSVAAARTFLVYAPSEAIGDPVHLSVAIPLTARIGESPADGAARAALTVEATAGTPVDWILDPRLVSAEGDQSAGEAGATLAAAVEDHAGRRSVFAVPWGDPDVSVLAHMDDDGAGSLFRLSRSLGRATIKAKLPSIAESVRHDLVWPLDPVDAQLLALVSRIGSDVRIASQPAVTAPAKRSTRPSPTALPRALSHSAAPAPLPTPASTHSPVASPTDPGRLSTWPKAVQLAAPGASGYAIVSDPELTAAIDVGVQGATDAVAAQYTAALLAMRVHAFHDGQATEGAVVIVPRSSTADVAALARRTEHLLALPWVQPVPLASAIEGSAGPVVQLGPGADSTRGPDDDVLERLNDAAHQLNAFSVLTPDPSGLMAEWSPRLLAPVASSLIPARDRTHQATDVVDAASDLVKAVATVKGSQVTMISATSELPVVIENTSPFDIRLTVGLRAATRALVTDKTVDVALEPDARATVRVPVHAIANGDVDVTVHLLNADGEDVGAPSTFRVRVHAEWENIGTAVFSGLIGALFVAGLVKAIRRRRTAARDQSPPPSAGTDPPGDLAPSDASTASPAP
jgi:hypothetical protein